jgi:CubicO group peptidase (beta-lactamase class C family)
LPDTFSKTMTLLAGAGYATDRTGSQLYVSRYGDCLLDVAVGLSGTGRAMSTDSRVTWLCSSKPVLLLPLFQALAQAGVDEHEPVARFIPEYGHAGKADVTLAQLLTHTVPYRALGMTWSDDEGAYLGDESEVATASSWEDAVRVICETPLTAAPGRLVCYTAVSNWLILADVVQRLTGRPHEEMIRKLVLEPLGMDHTSVYVTEPSLPDLDLAPLWQVSDGEPQAHYVDRKPWLFSRWPGAACRGPARDMARPIECAAGWLCPESLDDGWRVKLLKPCRHDLADPVFEGAEVLWSLGLCVDPVVYGLPLSARAAGHTGVRSSLVFADLDTGVTISFLSSGMVPKAEDWGRKRRLVRAIYDDLGLPIRASRLRPTEGRTTWTRW